MIFGVAFCWFWCDNRTDNNFLQVKPLLCSFCSLSAAFCTSTVSGSMVLTQMCIFFFSGLCIFLSYSSAYVLRSVKVLMTPLV